MILFLDSIYSLLGFSFQMANTPSTPDPASDYRHIVSAERRYNTRLGLILFTIYLFLYVGFVLINALRADLMETIVLWGLNLAIVYGFGLILAAIFLALLFGAMCRSEPTVPSKTPSTGDVE